MKAQSQSLLGEPSGRPTAPICIPLILLGIVPFKTSFSSYVVVTNPRPINTKFSVCEIEIKSVI